MHKDIPWSSIGYIVFKRTYARQLDPDLPMDSPSEEWEDVIDRILESCETQFDCGFTLDEEDRIKSYMMDLKFTPAGRFLWTAGTPVIAKYGLGALQNCAGTVVDKPIEPFCWTFEQLMLGSGVGVNLQREYVDKLPIIRNWFKTPRNIKDLGADFIVPDSRAGWVKLLGKTLKAAFLSKHKDNGTFTYSTQIIRSKGEAIKGFGGTASGPVILVEGIKKIGKVLEKRRGKKLKSVDVLDIITIIGSITVAGNVRRSAILCIGDHNDIEFINAKNWNLGNVPNHRAMSNNSVACDDIEKLPKEFWNTYKEGGEPIGLINFDLSRSCGRLGETEYLDEKVKVFNP
jgi:ribonucleoside-triphosphate reductase